MDKRWVAYIDVTRTLAAVDWAELAASGRLWIVRPPPPPPSTPDHGAWCADVLLRSGAFSLVVLDGGAPLARGVAIRLTRLARESHAAFVVMRDIGDWGRGRGGGENGGSDGGREGAGGALVGGAVRIRVTRRPPPPAAPPGRREQDRWRSLGARLARASEGWEGGEGTLEAERGGSGRGSAPRASNERWGPRPVAAEEEIAPSLGNTFALTLSVEKGGTHHPVEVGCAIDVARRLCSNSEVPDRRGVAPRNRRGERASPDAPGVRRTASASADAGDTSGDNESNRGSRGNGSNGSNGIGSAGGATLAHKRRFAEPAIHRDEFLLPPVTRSSGLQRREGNANGRGRERGKRR